MLLMLGAACDGHYGNENWEFNADVLGTDRIQQGVLHGRSRDVQFVP